MHIRAQTNLHQTVVNKVLKALEGRNEIKAVKSIKVPLPPFSLPSLSSIFKETDPHLLSLPWVM